MGASHPDGSFDEDPLRRFDRLADEQRALRRVAVLVAQEPSPHEVFTAVTEAVGPLLGADLAAMHIFQGDGAATTIAGWSASGPMVPIGTRLPLDVDSTCARIFHTGAAARMDTYVDVAGEAAEVARALRLRSTVGAPILVDGRLWGALMAATRGEKPLPDDAETQIAAFTELVATAVSNAQSREDRRRLADEQSALRRVATLVAQGVEPAEIFSAVSGEAAALFGSGAAVLKFEPDSPAAITVGTSNDVGYPIGACWEVQDEPVLAAVARTRRPARVGAAGSSSPSTVASPIVVDGRVWGAMSLHSTDEVLPPETEGRLENFTELLATAIANAHSRSELAASRRRIVAASDAARRRIERDLHDGTQQRLVSLALQLRGAQARVPPALGELEAQLDDIAVGITDVLDELRELARGLHPAVLANGGLGPALKTLARRSAVPVALDLRPDGRPPEHIEVGAYYVVSEALANAAKHANASAVAVQIEAVDGFLRVSVRDDGVGGARFERGSGLVGLKDRVEALGGLIVVESAPGKGTAVRVDLPLSGELVPSSDAPEHRALHRSFPNAD
jgi:signal transduction histidine kinase